MIAPKFETSVLPVKFDYNYNPIIYHDQLGMFEEEY